VQVLVPALVVIVIGGLGSISGAAAAALLLGALEALGTTWLPSGVTTFLPYLALVVVLSFRPAGLLARSTR